MKLFLLIFNLYFFALSCLPCNDAGLGHFVQGSGETAVLAKQHDSPTHEHCNDFCTPLCICGCCGQVTASERIAALELAQPDLNIQSPVFNYQSPYSGAYVAAIFRPPVRKLG